MVRQTICSQQGMVILEYSFELESDLSELKALRQHLNNYGKVIGLSEACLFDINVCLDEIFTNIVSYGFTDESAHLITFTVKAIGDELIIDVEDDGVPFNPLEVKDPMVPEDLVHLKIGGLGIHIVKKLMNKVCYKREQGKNKLTLNKCIELYT
jgi:anti-sigma regulatory factor (Ser/Thr protein kinase)